ncbi:DUF732 domain-containing protein [Corynebacterium sp. ACRQK]|uniref:DUF732 domain-containing protein n=1 Tax=Corynebacterium sp. ACRQL TaxID=2918191 RepID=UPI001EF6CD00|nr:DUF732 domain-containing protein [Corynebacterium sp. ACRQK]MCG7263701.1 DUF732 domain-containing protein [Corynebacterium sp. ACRQL]
MAAGAACAALLSLATLTACGGDETVDNSAESTTVPSVTESATETEKSDGDDDKDGKDAKGDEDGESGSSEGNDAPEPAGDRGGAPAQDGAVGEVDDIPSGAQRSDEDKDFLKRLKDSGIDLAKANDAAEIGGLEDQLIAAGHAHCAAEGGGQADVYTPLAAGQLEANGVIDGDPKKAEDAIRKAAKSAYC